jgi:hypothetical protein
VEFKMPTFQSAALVAVTAQILSATASAQHTPRTLAPLAADTRVRITVAQSLQPVTGVVVAHRTDTLIVRTEADGSAMILPLGQIVSIEVSHGVRRSARHGAFVGLGTGAMVGLVVGAVTYRKADCTHSSGCLDLGPAADMAAGMGVGGLAGLMAGALIGSLPVEHWAPAPTVPEGKQRLGIAPRTRGGAGLTVTLAF